MTINGTPLHPLIVHAAVVFTPLAALAVIGFFLLRRWRLVLRWPTLALTVVGGLAIVAAFLSGNSFFNGNQVFRQNSLILQHKQHAGQLLWVGIAFAVVAVLAVLTTAVSPDGREPAARVGAPAAVAIGLGVLAVLLALAVLVLVAIVGDLGARATWGGNGLF